MNLNKKLVAIIGATAVATAAAVYAAIAVHKKKERDLRLKESEDWFKDFESQNGVDSSVLVPDPPKDLTAGFEQCKDCPNKECPYCGLDSTGRTNDWSDTFGAEKGLNGVNPFTGVNLFTSATYGFNFDNDDSEHIDLGEGFVDNSNDICDDMYYSGNEDWIEEVCGENTSVDPFECDDDEIDPFACDADDSDEPFDFGDTEDDDLDADFDFEDTKADDLDDDLDDDFDFEDTKDDDLLSDTDDDDFEEYDPESDTEDDEDSEIADFESCDDEDAEFEPIQSYGTKDTKDKNLYSDFDEAEGNDLSDSANDLLRDSDEDPKFEDFE